MRSCEKKTKSKPPALPISQQAMIKHWPTDGNLRFAAQKEKLGSGSRTDVARRSKRKGKESLCVARTRAFRQAGDTMAFCLYIVSGRGVRVRAQVCKDAFNVMEAIQLL